MNAKKIAIWAIFPAAVAALLAGCSSGNARYVDTGGSRSVISTRKINMADWNNAASSLVDELLSSGKLESFKQPVKMKVSRIVNRTSNAIDTDLLTRQICIVLNNSGKAETVSEDAATSELAEYEAFMKNEKVSAPKITMTGKIIEDRDSNDDLDEVTYVFFLEVNAGGKAIWQGQKQITKQSERSSFGF